MSQSSLTRRAFDLEQEIQRRVLATEHARRDLGEFFQQACAAGAIAGVKRLEWGRHLALYCMSVQLQLEGWLVAYGKGDAEMVARQREAWERTGAAWEDKQPNPWERYVLMQNAIDNLPPSTLKPCDVDGLVVEKTRGLVRLGDIAVGDRVLTHAGRFRAVEAVADQGVLPTLTIVTQRGRRIRVAGDHPVLTARGWTRADQVVLHDVLAEVHQSEPCGSDSISAEEARLIAYLIGDGRIQGSVGFTNGDPETLTDFKACVATVGLEAVVAAKRPMKSGGHTYQMRVRKPRSCACECGSPVTGTRRWCASCIRERARESERRYLRRGGPLDPDSRAAHMAASPNSAVRQWCQKHDLWGSCSYTKRVPRAIMSGSDDLIAEYLAAYWACDGGIYERRDLKAPKGGRANRAVRIDATTVSEGLARDHQALLQRLGMSFTLLRQDLKIESKRQGKRYIAYKLYAHDQDTAAKFMEIIGPRMRHEKRGRLPGLGRTGFDRTLHADAVVAIEPSEPTACRCLQIEEDSSFVYQGVVVHNSSISMVSANAWIWLWAPAFSFIAASGVEANVDRDSQSTRDLVRSQWYRDTFAISWRDVDVEIPMEVRKDSDAISLWATTAGGKRDSRTINSGWIGAHGDGILIDDPDDPDKVFNEADRLKPQNRFTRAMENRTNDDNRSIRRVLQQRVHVEDFTAYLLSLSRWSPQNPRGWFHFCLPAEFGRGPADAPTESPYGLKDWRTEIGETLHARLSPGILADHKAKRPEYEALYNQNPGRRGDGLFKAHYARFFIWEHQQGQWLRPRPEGCVPREELPPVIIKPGELRDVTLSVDAANSLDPTPGAKVSAVGLTVDACRGDERLVLDDCTRVLGVSATYKAIYQIAARWPLDRIIVELKALGAGVISELTLAIKRGWYIDPDTDEKVPLLGPDGQRIRCVVEPYSPGKEDKIQRANGMLPDWQQGLFLLHDGADWLYPKIDASRKTLDEGFIGEVCSFPASRRSDRVDSLSQFHARYRTTTNPREEWQAMRRLASLGGRR